MKPATAIAILLLLACISTAVWIARHPSAPAESQAMELTGSTMGGSWSIKLRRLPAGSSAAQLQQAVADLLDRLEGQMSSWRDGSTVSQFNRYHETGWFPVPPELAEVVTEAQRVSEQTDGAFDITVAPLVELWGFGPSRAAAGPRRELPSEEEITAARQHIGYRMLKCRLQPPALRKVDPQLTIDLGGIGKGFAADQVGAYLDSRGVNDYLIAVGGELRARGSSGKGSGWLVGIETPTPDVRRILTTLELRDASLSTSGDYRNFIEIHGQRFCHEIDPRTGHPIEHRPAAVSIVHASGASADALATGLMVLGVEQGEPLARAQGLAVLFVTRGDAQFEERRSPKFPPPSPRSSSSGGANVNPR